MLRAPSQPSDKEPVKINGVEIPVEEAMKYALLHPDATDELRVKGLNKIKQARECYAITDLYVSLNRLQACLVVDQSEFTGSRARKRFYNLIF